MIETIVKAVRLPKDLFDLVMSCNKGLTFTDVVRNLLTKEYSFTSCKQEENNDTKNITKSVTSDIIDPNITIENEIDKILSCAQDKKKRGEV